MTEEGDQDDSSPNLDGRKAGNWLVPARAGGRLPSLRAAVKFKILRGNALCSVDFSLQPALHIEALQVKRKTA